MIFISERKPESAQRSCLDCAELKNVLRLLQKLPEANSRKPTISRLIENQCTFDNSHLWYFHVSTISNGKIFLIPCICLLN